MSFVNLMASDVWSEADIINRTESLIRQHYSVADEQILNRKVTGAMLGQYTLTDDEHADIARYAEVCEAARQEGDAARADMATLQKALDYDAAQSRLAQAVPELPETVITYNEAGDSIEVPNPAIAQEETERQAAQAVINAASDETLELVAVRAPEPEPAEPLDDDELLAQ